MRLGWSPLCRRPNILTARIVVAVLSLAAAAGGRARAQAPPPAYALERLADGVWAVIRQEPPGLGVEANNVIIINQDHVVVVDANMSVPVTRAVLAEIRRLTPLPVRYVINTHFHDDHVTGNFVYREAFPAVEFIGWSGTAAFMAESWLANRRSTLEGLPGFIARLRSAVSSGKSLMGWDLDVEERSAYEKDIRLAEQFLVDGPDAPSITPTIGVDDRLVLNAGGRVIEVLRLGAGHSPGDLVVHLPAESIVIVGDLVSWPVPYMGTPSTVGEWQATLAKVRSLEAAMIVPAHGPVLRDHAFLRQMERLFGFLGEQARAAVARGETLDQARQSIDLRGFLEEFAQGSNLRGFLFRAYVRDPGIAVAWREAGGRGGG